MSTDFIPNRDDFLARLVAVQTQLKNYPDATLVAVTKYATPEQTQWAINAGLMHLGENKVQSAVEKKLLLNRPDVHWHLIGHLQTNKVRHTVGQFALIHSVDSVKLAEKISEANVVHNIVQPVLLQANISGEATKQGFLGDELQQHFPLIAQLPGLSLKGLMTMAPHTDEVSIVRKSFAGLVDLQKSLQDRHQVPLPELSMGMSNDYGHALELGATIIRLGSVLFGNYFR